MYTYINKIKNGVSFKQFYLKRYFRLFPILLISDITYEILSIMYFHLYNAYYCDINPSFWDILISSLGIQDGGVFPNPCVNNPTWYVSVLLICYTIFLLLYIFQIELIFHLIIYLYL